jgi:aromatic ring-opening dioxygenase catalytic subunit (LigB family)
MTPEDFKTQTERVSKAKQLYDRLHELDELLAKLTHTRVLLMSIATDSMAPRVHALGGLPDSTHVMQYQMPFSHQLCIEIFTAAREAAIKALSRKIEELRLELERV